MKEKFIKAHMKVAEIYSELSSARRLKVGSIVVKDDKIISIGYNGMPAGWDNNCEHEKLDGTLVTKDEVIHAEQNALDKLSRTTGGASGSTMFVTHAPCIQCAKQIANSGIKQVFFKNIYRSQDGVLFLRNMGVDTQQIQ